MPIGFIIGTIFALFLAYGPAVLIILSNRASGWSKAKWVILSLLPPLAMGVIGILMVLFLVNSHSDLVLKLSPAFNLVGFAGAWVVFWLFKRRVVATI